MYSKTIKHNTNANIYIKLSPLLLVFLICQIVSLAVTGVRSMLSSRSVNAHISVHIILLAWNKAISSQTVV